jgi:ribosomal protein S20
MAKWFLSDKIYLDRFHQLAREYQQEGSRDEAHMGIARRYSVLVSAALAGIISKNKTAK